MKTKTRWDKFLDRANMVAAVIGIAAVVYVIWFELVRDV